MDGVVQPYQSIAEQSEPLFSMELDSKLKAKVQRYAAQILASRSSTTIPDSESASVRVGSLELVRPRRVGIEQMALHAQGY